MGSFKHWLLKESIAADNETFGDVQYVSQPSDYPYSTSDPNEFYWLKWRWKMDRRIGRPFHNIDVDDFERRKFISVGSADMPDAGDGFSKHKPSNRPSQVVKTHDTLGMLDGTNSKNLKSVSSPKYLSIDGELEQRFGDKHSGKWPQAASDIDWTKPVK